MHIPGIEILKDLYFIERGYLNANHFIYRGDPPTLIDTGYIADFDTTRRIITAIGVDLTEVSAIITTHCHCDHIGGHNRIQQLSGCDIFLHNVGKMFIDTRDDWATWWKYYHQQAEFFTPTHGLNDGDTISVGPHRFEVIYTPGHAADGIVLYHRREKILISSDTLWERDMAVHTVRVEGNAAAYYTKKCLERLSSLDVALVCPGHGAAFADFQGALKRSMDRVEGYVTNRQVMGRDVLKKIIVYTLMMKKTVVADQFFGLLMDTNWFKETVDLYFNSDYRGLYTEIMEKFLSKGIVERKGAFLHTTVKP
jgi:glyoxylase-like metal-dependent hydrolase (beta-lactamase superfamily II)